MTIISNKSILTLSITAILVAGAFMFSPILVDAVKKQTCPSGQVMTGIDDKNNIVCTPGTGGTLPNIYHKQATSNTAAGGGGSGMAIAHCDSGDRAISGGFAGDTFRIEISALTDANGQLSVNPSSWFVTAFNIGQGASFYDIFVYCLDETP